MKKQVQLVCSPADKICLWMDKLERCCRLLLEQAKLRQLLEKKSNDFLIWKLFER